VADKYPYMSGTGSLVQIVSHLRRSFPAGGVTADTLKKLGLAPNNESYIINALRFVDVIDEEGKKTEGATRVFSQHDDAAFQQAFAALVEAAYSGLFELHGGDAWTLDRDALIQFFRSTDDTSAIVGSRQASTFVALSSLSGHGDAPVVKTPSAKRAQGEARSPKPPAGKKAGTQVSPLARSGDGAHASARRDVGLTVRIEVNLPADGDQQTYDRIFKSIRENLIDAE
jgi:hypothetical protein